MVLGSASHTRAEVDPSAHALHTPIVDSGVVSIVANGGILLEGRGAHASQDIALANIVALVDAGAGFSQTQESAYTLTVCAAIIG